MPTVCRGERSRQFRKRSHRLKQFSREAAIRTAAQANGLPVDAVTPVSVPDPYFYRET
jgi:hypothetical protein